MIRPNLLAWQWSDYSAKHRDRVNLLLHLVAVPLFLAGTLRFLDLLVVGDENRFVEHTVRVVELPPAEAAAARARILAAIPPRTGRVT